MTARIAIDNPKIEADENGKCSKITEFVKSRAIMFYWMATLSRRLTKNHISITLSFKYGSKPFIDKSLYIETFTSHYGQNLSNQK